MIDIMISGINGRLGREVYALASKTSEFNVVCGVDKHAFGDFNCPIYPTVQEADGHFDAIVDFSSPSALDGLLQKTEEYGCALLVCTTGHSPKQREQIEQTAKRLPVRIMHNTSRGILAIEQILPKLSELLSDFDVCLTETHRKHKKDAPSGTAVALKELIKDAPVQTCSFRAGNVPGTHTVAFCGEFETVTLTHTALSSSAFAKGALDAVRELVNTASKQK